MGVVSAANIWGTYKGKQIIRLTVDGSPVKASDAPAVLMDGRTMIPIYLLKEAGINYSWDSKKQTVDVKSSASGENPADFTKSIMNLGGGGLTITKVSGDMTSIVYFYETKGFDSDWASIDSIFQKLLPIDTVYMRIVYVQSGGKENIIDMKRTDYIDFLNGAITNDELHKRMTLVGPLFNSASGNNSIPSATIDYPELYSNDLKTYLGKLTSNEYDSESIFNEYGDYGSKYSSTSIWNEYSDYGSKYSNESAFNKYATEPPVIVLKGKIIGYLTLNTSYSNAISPAGLIKWIENNGY